MKLHLFPEVRRKITEELAEAAPAAEVVALHPAMLARYEEQLTRLQVVLGDGLRAGDSECADAIRDLIGTVTVSRDHSWPGGVQVEISGRLTALLGEQAYPNRVKGVWGKMVAEVRYSARPHYGERFVLLLAGSRIESKIIIWLPPASSCREADVELAAGGLGETLKRLRSRQDLAAFQSGNG